MNASILAIALTIVPPMFDEATKKEAIQPQVQETQVVEVQEKPMTLEEWKKQNQVGE